MHSKIDNHSTSYLASAQCEDNINMNTISWSVILTLLYKKNPEELRSENIQISSQIWQSTGKRIFFFQLRWQNATYLKLSSCFYHRFKEKRSQKDPMLTNGMQKLETKRKKEKLCMLKKITSWWQRFQEFALGSKSLSY